MDTKASPGYELQTTDFRGPLVKLLELIEEKELEITRLNLAEVTADFIAYLERLEHKVHHRELADFVVVAAKLILIKSHALLPNLELSEEEEKDMAELEARLKLYKELRLAERSIDELWGKYVSYGRPFLLNVPQGFYLTQKVQPKELYEHIKLLAEGLVDLQKMEEGEVKMVSLEEKIKELFTWINGRVKTSFGDLSEGKEKSEVVVLFLALLHLFKDFDVSIEQDELFAEIKIIKSNG